MFYIVPTALTMIPGSPGGTVTAPKYVDFTIPFASVPYGVESRTILSINANLAPASDLFAFPADLSQALANSDVTALDNYCAPANLPSAWVTVGMTFAEVLRQISQIHLLAQFLSGKTAGKSIFPSGVTLGTKYQSLPVGSALSPAAVSVGVNSGLFDFSGVQSADTVGNILTAVSQQFTQPVDFNGAAVIPSGAAVVSTGVTI